MDQNAPDQTARRSHRSGPPERASLGRYRIIRRLGQGGMGSVYLAEDTHLKRPVALKIPDFEGDLEGDLLSRFYREARAAATIHHSHLCPVYDVGECDGTHYLTMAYIEGEPLSARTRQPERPWSILDAAALVRQLSLAIHEAHEKGVVHRDLKPANIMLTKQGEPVIVDFGLARRADCDDMTLTQLGTLIGTPAYMSPEQVEGDSPQIGPLTDVYALGVVLYELLAGRPPFLGSIASVLGQICRDAPQPPSSFRAGLDAWIELICLKMMARRPVDRYASALEAAQALEGYLKKRAGSDPPPEPLRPPAHVIAPPASSQETYAVSSAPVVTQRTAASPGPQDEAARLVEFRERVQAFLTDGQIAEALLALQAAPQQSPAGKRFRQAFVAGVRGAIEANVQARRVKGAVRIAAAFHAGELADDAPDLLPKTLSAAARAAWNPADPAPALQLWKDALARFPEETALRSKAGVFAANRGVEREQSGQWDLALRLFREALIFDPSSGSIRKRFEGAAIRRATQLVKAGRLDEALALCEEGLRLVAGSRRLSEIHQTAQNLKSQQE